MDSVKQKLENPNKLTLKQVNKQLKATTPSLTASFPFHPTITKKIKKSLTSHDVKVTSSPGTSLRDLLTKTKTTPPPHLTPNVVYEISFNDCTATYNGQTNRPLLMKRIKENESHLRGVQAYHVGKKVFELGVEMEGQDTSRNFEGCFGSIRALLPM